MNDQSKTWTQLNWLDTPNVISSPESEDGVTRSNSRDGRKKEKSGQEAARASRSQSQEKLTAWATSGIYGQLFIGSSPSAILQSCLENKLRERLDVNGSVEYALTWKHWDMLSGPQVCALQSSIRRTEGQEYIGWPTPDTYPARRGPSQIHRNSPGIMALVEWSTPTSRDWKGHTITPNHPKGYNTNIPNQLMGWSTPMVADGKKHTARSHQENLVKQVIGQTGPQSNAATVKRAVLHPDLPRWLMGYPPEWCDCAVMAMPLSRKSPPSS